MFFIDLEFPRCKGDPSRKIVEIPGGGGSTVKASGTENPGGWVGGPTGKKPSLGGVAIFWNHTICVYFITKMTCFYGITCPQNVAWSLFFYHTLSEGL